MNKHALAAILALAVLVLANGIPLAQSVTVAPARDAESIGEMIVVPECYFTPYPTSAAHPGEIWISTPTPETYRGERGGPEHEPEWGPEGLFLR